MIKCGSKLGKLAHLKTHLEISILAEKTAFVNLERKRVLIQHYKNIVH